MTDLSTKFENSFFKTVVKLLTNNNDGDDSAIKIHFTIILAHCLRFGEMFFLFYNLLMVELKVWDNSLILQIKKK